MCARWKISDLFLLLKKIVIALLSGALSKSIIKISSRFLKKRSFSPKKSSDDAHSVLVFLVKIMTEMVDTHKTPRSSFWFFAFYGG